MVILSPSIQGEERSYYCLHFFPEKKTRLRVIGPEVTEPRRDWWGCGEERPVLRSEVRLE